MRLGRPSAETAKRVFEAEFFKVLTPDLDWSVAILGTVAREDFVNRGRRVVLKVELGVAVGEIADKRKGEGNGLGIVDFWTVFALNAAVTLLIKLAR